MPRRRIAAKVADADAGIVVALEAFTPDGHVFIRKGDRLAATHELARRHANYFAPDATDAVTRLVALTELHGHAAPAPEPAPEPVRMMRAIKPVSGVVSVANTAPRIEGGLNAPTVPGMFAVNVDDVLPETHGLVARFPSAFKPVKD